jgi:hypothetical protein
MILLALTLLRLGEDTNTVASLEKLIISLHKIQKGREPAKADPPQQ